MDFTLATLKRCAATAEAELVVLTAGSRIPAPRPGDCRREQPEQTGKERGQRQPGRTAYARRPCGEAQQGQVRQQADREEALDAHRTSPRGS